MSCSSNDLEMIGKPYITDDGEKYIYYKCSKCSKEYERIEDIFSMNKVISFKEIPSKKSWRMKLLDVWLRM